jgi:hypothetical protein
MKQSRVLTISDEPLQSTNEITISSLAHMLLKVLVVLKYLSCNSSE